MKVADLIELLKAHDQDAEVGILSETGDARQYRPES